MIACLVVLCVERNRVRGIFFYEADIQQTVVTSAWERHKIHRVAGAVGHHTSKYHP
jgi:hypothetical protein